jgi:hypothetical protein
VLVVDIPVEHIEKGNRNAKNDSQGVDGILITLPQLQIGRSNG